MEYQLRGDMYSIHSCCWSATAYKWKVHERKIVIISFVASSSSTLTFSRHDRVDVKHKSLTLQQQLCMEYMSPLSWYSIACGYYQNSFNRGLLLLRKLQNTLIVSFQVHKCSPCDLWFPNTSKQKFIIASNEKNKTLLTCDF
jgi:hypothetical protein